MKLSRLLQSFSRYYHHKNKLDELIFSVTYRCNFRCKTCFYVDYMNASTMNNVAELTIDEIAKVSFSLGRFSKLLLSGGEPFLRDDLPEICEIFCRKNGVNLIHLPTNGFYSDKISYYVDKILAKCPNTELILSLPLDGFAKTHDKIKGVQGSFEKVIKTTERLAPLREKFDNLTVNIISVVNNININEMIMLAEFIKNELSVDSHGPSPVRGKPYDQDLAAPSAKQWRDLSEQLMPFYSFWNKKRMSNKIFGSLVTNKMRYLYMVYSSVLEGRQLPFKCQAGNALAVLEPNGDVKLCELTKAVGNIRSTDYDLKKVLNSPNAQDMFEKIKNCACTHACFLETSIKMDPAALLKAYFCFEGGK